MKGIIKFLILIISVRIVSAQELSNITEQKPFTMNGSVSTLGSLSTGTTTYANAALSGVLTPTVYGFSFPFSFTLSTYGNNYSQPFNIAGISPSYKWIKTHFGYRNMSFSKYTLNGIQFLGAGIELTPADFVRIGAMSGRFRSAVEEDTLKMGSAIPSYQRNGYAFKLGFGGSTNYIDLSFSRITDDTTSLRKRPIKNLGITPQDNAAVGISSRFSLSGFSLEAEAGASLLTKNTLSTIVNLDSTNIPKFITQNYTTHLTSSLTFAGRAAASYTSPQFGVRAGIEYTEPEYQTLGSTGVYNDYIKWNVAPYFSMLNGSLRLSGNYSTQHDDLFKVKIFETSSNSISGNISYNALNWGFDINASNSTLSQTTRNINFKDDSLRANNSSFNIGLSPRYTLASEELSHMFLLSINSNIFTDKNLKTAIYSNNSSHSVSASYSCDNSKININYGTNLIYTTNSSAQNNSSSIGFSVNGSKNFLKDNTLSVSSSLSYNHSKYDAISYNIVSLSANSTYKITKEDNISLNTNTTFSKGESSSPAINFTGGLNYSRSFNIVK